LKFGEVPFGLIIFANLGDKTEGFEGIEVIFNLSFTAGGVFELGGDGV
jgi:hypothetical protein